MPVLVMYSRSNPCPFVNIAKRVLAGQNIPYLEIHIDHDEKARQQVIDWTGFESVPTLVIVPEGEVLPAEAPAHLERGYSPRGIDRGIMLTEPNETELKNWLKKHGFPVK